MLPAMRHVAEACYWHAMPEDYPGRTKAGDIALQQYAIAKQLDPSQPDPEVSQ
jgi:hypothetical protein